MPIEEESHGTPSLTARVRHRTVPRVRFRANHQLRPAQQKTRSSPPHRRRSYDSTPVSTSTSTLLLTLHTDRSHPNERHTHDTNSGPEVGHLIGGEHRVSNLREVNDRGRLRDVVARVSVGDETDVDRAVNAAHGAYSHWRTTPITERIQFLTAAAEVVANAEVELAPLLVREHGGMLWEAQTDFHIGTGMLHDTAGLIRDFLQPVEYTDANGRISIEKTARGVVGAIIPWNMPIALTFQKLAPALAAGNTFVLKPSPSASAALTLLLQRVAELLPAGVLNVVHGDGDVGAALCSHPLVRKIAFTGGTSTGIKVIEATARTIKNVTLELGGNDPAVILDDADIDTTLERLLKGVFTRSGQICFGVKRIYVPRALSARFATALCERVDHYSVGHGLDPEADFGPLNNEVQYKKVLNLIERTHASFATVLELGNKTDPSGWEDGYFILPHVVRDAEHSAPISSEEQFGPVIPLITYDNEDQVLHWANDSEYGLGSSVWTSDADWGFAFARKIEAGSTFINSHSFDSLDLRMP
ncbi:aldehyde dehydrogenase family protein [Rhodococcus erythropolis]|uniref:aldehyde dehydrogenase family protein n=1 Tax=Rhodococcus erythropolis TaxID=1833 RepID=UPI0009C0781A|nr:aldehyde dehydrogenase family protein [Rhodococcus erythropolis]